MWGFREATFLDQNLPGILKALQILIKLRKLKQSIRHKTLFMRMEEILWIQTILSTTKQAVLMPEQLKEATLNAVTILTILKIS